MMLSIIAQPVSRVKTPVHASFGRWLAVTVEGVLRLAGSMAKKMLAISKRGFEIAARVPCIRGVNVFRDITPVLGRAASRFPAITLPGPRQSGKSTLCKTVFPSLPVANLEEPDVRAFATDDPRRFLDGYPNGAVLDEAVLSGGYPAIYDRKLAPAEWLAPYVATYLERDVRSEIVKHRTNRGETGGLFFYRDRHGTEADLVIQAAAGQAWRPYPGSRSPIFAHDVTRRDGVQTASLHLQGLEVCPAL